MINNGDELLKIFNLKNCLIHKYVMTIKDVNNSIYKIWEDSFGICITKMKWNKPDLMSRRSKIKDIVFPVREI